MKEILLKLKSDHITSYLFSFKIKRQVLTMPKRPTRSGLSLLSQQWSYLTTVPLFTQFHMASMLVLNHPKHNLFSRPLHLLSRLPGISSSRYPLLGSYANVIWSWRSSVPVLPISTCVRAHTYTPTSASCYPLTLIYVFYHHPTYSHFCLATCYLTWGSTNPRCLQEIQNIRPYPRLAESEPAC